MRSVYFQKNAQKCSIRFSIFKATEKPMEFPTQTMVSQKQDRTKE